jgi:hypothetical protein
LFIDDRGADEGSSFGTTVLRAVLDLLCDEGVCVIFWLMMIITIVWMIMMIYMIMMMTLAGSLCIVKSRFPGLPVGRQAEGSADSS